MEKQGISEHEVRDDVPRPAARAERGCRLSARGGGEAQWSSTLMAIDFGFASSRLGRVR
jgi:hypothetical protein